MAAMPTLLIKFTDPASPAPEPTQAAGPLRPPAGPAVGGVLMELSDALGAFCRGRITRFGLLVDLERFLSANGYHAAANAVSAAIGAEIGAERQERVGVQMAAIEELEEMALAAVREEVVAEMAGKVAEAEREAAEKIEREVDKARKMLVNKFKQMRHVSGKEVPDTIPPTIDPEFLQTLLDKFQRAKYAEIIQICEKVKRQAVAGGVEGGIVGQGTPVDVAQAMEEIIDKVRKLDLVAAA
ncbi:hypothetical protein DFJ74DRAFT_642104 [Hyaloraphidium curvatum]|nr:hypothetical protein DFJ74DRAFT_642104 [Hyaloraphidium curvatum]